MSVIGGEMHSQGPPGCIACLKSELLDPIKSHWVPIVSILVVIGYLVSGYWWSNQLVCVLNAAKSCDLDVGIYVFGTIVIPLALCCGCAMIVFLVYGVYVLVRRWHAQYFTMTDIAAA